MLVEIVAGRDSDAALVARGAAFVRADRQAAAAGEERAGLPRQSRARAVPDDGDALRRRRHRARGRRRGRASRSACRWGRSSSPTPSASTSASPSVSMLGHEARRRRASSPSCVAAGQLGKKTGQRLLRVGRRQAAEAAGTSACPPDSARRLDRSARRRSEGGARRRHRRRRRPRRRRRDIRHGLRAVSRRPAAVRSRRAARRFP